MKIIILGVVSGAALLALYKALVKNKRKKCQDDEISIIESHIHQNITTLIGNTPMIKIQSLSKATGCTILGKAEFLSIGGSSKDRVALSIVNEAEVAGFIKPNIGCTIFEGTVGSTGISLALIARSKGYNCHIVMPGSNILLLI